MCQKEEYGRGRRQSRGQRRRRRIGQYSQLYNVLVIGPSTAHYTLHHVSAVKFSHLQVMSDTHKQYEGREASPYSGTNCNNVMPHNGMVRSHQYITKLQHSADTVCAEQLNKSGKNKVVYLCVYATLLRMADMDCRNMAQCVRTQLCQTHTLCSVGYLEPY